LEKTERLLSLDALRGFDMLWISGGPGIIKGLYLVTGWQSFSWLRGQMNHVPWEGFSFYDMIFPLFLFIAGISLPFSITNRLNKGETRKEIYKHMFTRLGLLIILGMIYNGFLYFNWDDIRFASVLARIGFAWFFAALIYLNCALKWQVIWFWIFLLGYWAAMTLIPVPGYGAGVLTLEGNFSGYIDRLFLPGISYFQGKLDPEGLFSTIPSISTALLGVFTGQLLMDKKLNFSKNKKGIILLLSGFVCMGIGALWGVFFPIIKNLWTSSYVFYAGGLSLIFFAVFYLIIDIWGFKKWAFPFIVIGLNSITIYMIQPGIINFSSMNDYFFSGFTGLFSENWQALVSSSGYVLCVWLFLYFLFRHKIFLKV